MRIRNLRDMDKDRQYQRIWGGLAWPGEKPGFAVVLAEELSMDPAPRLFTLVEIEEENIERLITRCIELTSEFSVKEWYGRTTDNAINAYLQEYNSKAIDRHRSTFDIMDAPYSNKGQIHYHVNILLEKLRPTNTRLFLHKESRLDSFLNELPAGKISTAKDTDYLAIAALGYVVAAFDLHEYVIGGDFKHKTAITEYDVWGRNKKPTNIY